MNKNYLLIWFFLSIPIFLYGNDIKTPYWIGVGYGISTSPINSSIKQAYGSINIRYNNIFYVQAQGRFSGFVGDKDCLAGTIRLIDSGLLTGILYDLNNFVQLGISGGLSYVYCEEYQQVTHGSDRQCQGFHEITHRTIGVPLDLQFFFVPFKLFGIGLSAHASINRYVPYIGCSLIAKYGYIK